MKLADRTTRIAESPTMKVTATVDRLRRSGVDVIDFGAGEPDFPTPDAIKAAAHEAIDRNFTRYTPVAGIADLKRAICDRYKTDYGVDYKASQVIVTAGGKQALYNTALSLFGPGDEVITHAPCWPTLTEQIKLADATPVLARTHPEDGFAIRAKTILDAVTPRTRGIIVNSPGNPTGALIAEAELRAIAEAAARAGHLGHRRSLLREADLRRCAAQPAASAGGDLPRAGGAVRLGVEGLRDDRLALRLADRAGGGDRRVGRDSEPLDVERHVDHAEGGRRRADGSQAPVTAMLDEYRKRRDQLHAWLTADPRLRCRKPAGAFYMFVDISDVLSADGFRTSLDFADALLEESRVAVTPGEAFDAPGTIRISYATSMENLREGSTRLLAFVGKHAPQTAAAS